MPRQAAAVALLLTAGLVPVTAASAGWSGYPDPVMLLVAGAAGYAAGTWLPRPWAALGVGVTATLLVVANQLADREYHWLDDLVFFLVVVGGPAVAGAAVTLRAGQVHRLERLRAELEDQHRVEAAALRLDEQSRVLGEVHSRLAEQIAGIALRSEGARRAGDATALAAIEEEARSVLDRLRGALGSMRGTGTSGEPPDAADPAEDPAPGGAARPTVLDVAVPAVLAAAIAVETALIDGARGPLWANALAAFVVASPLVLRRRHPIPAVAATSTAGVAMSALLTPLPETVTGVALLTVIFYSVGAWCRRHWWLLGWLVAVLGSLAMDGVTALVTVDTGAAGDDAWIVLLWTVGATALGRITAGWQARVRRTQDVVEALERGRGATLRLAVAEQREALASQLHDTVAHAMTVVCLQAGGVRRAGGDVDAALRVIGSVAERSLAELREGLEAMESAEDPLDGARLAALGRRVGVDLRVDAEGGGSGAAAALAHRVIREAVVNVARHAPGASAAVRVHGSAGDLAVEVVDDGGREPVAGRGGEGVPGTGTGLRGLARALESVGGRLEWGTREPCGFRVAALIPRELP